jgi:hypothetical protein
MTQLTATNLFTVPTSLFGLRKGQVHYKGKVTHNSEWYNINGEYLGYGDLSEENLKRISEEIAPNEIFLSVPEYAPAAFEKHAISWRLGRDDIRMRANIAITRGRIYIIRPSRYDHLTNILGVPVEFIERF